MTVSKAIFVAAALAARAAVGQTQTSGADFVPVDTGGQVTTNAHNDNTGVDTTNVRVSGYSFQSVPDDPNFTQDPGFNATTASGLPPSSVFSFDLLDSLKYWNGSGPVTLSAPPDGESLIYNFAASYRTLNGTSGAQSGFNIGAVASTGAIHKHLNAFLADGTGSYDPSATPTPGVYVAQMRLNDTGLTSSPAIFPIYANGAPTSSLDRAAFYLRNHFAPGSNLVGESTSMIGLSAQPGETNLATGGQVTVTNGVSEIDDLTTNAEKGSVVINAVAPSRSTVAVLWFNGSAADVSSLISNLNIPEAYTIAAANAPSSDPLYGDIQTLKATYGGFGAIAEFTPTAANTAFTWDFAANPDVLLDKIAAVPKPAVSGTWAVSTGGSWSVAANWTGGVPTNAGDTATLGTVVTSASTITLDTARTVGHLIFDSPISYTIAGTPTLTIDDTGATVVVAAGSHTIAVPVALAAGVAVNTSAGSTVSITGPISGAGPITKLGGGRLTLSGVDSFTGGIAVTAGSVTLSTASALPAFTALSVAAGAAVAVSPGAHGALAIDGLTLGGTLDLSDHDLIVRDSSPAAVVGLFTGGHLTSASAGQLTTLGIVSNGSQFTQFDGVPTAAADVLVRYTYFGDANLDGKVDGSDYTKIDGGYLTHAAGWANGDFNYDGVVDGSDYTLIDDGFSRQAVSMTATAMVAPAAVPEPAAVAVAVAGGLAFGRRNRRCGANRTAGGDPSRLVPSRHSGRRREGQAGHRAICSTLRQG